MEEASVVFLLEMLDTVLRQETLGNADDGGGSRCIQPGEQQEEDGGGGRCIRARVGTMNDVEVKIPVLLVAAAARGVDIQGNDFFGSVVHDGSKVSHMERMLEEMVDDTANDVNTEEDTILDCLDNMPLVNSVKIEHAEEVAAVLQVNEDAVETSRNLVVGNHQKTVSVEVHHIHEDEVVDAGDNLDPHVGA